jgi:hypothetical protein
VAAALEALAKGLDGHGRALQDLRRGLRELDTEAEGNPPVVQLRARLALTRISQP